MAGREKIKCYEYDLQGKYIREYESIQEVRDKFYPNDKGKRPIIFNKEGYFKIENYGFIANHKIGRDTLRINERIKNSKYCNYKSLDDEKEIEIYNLKGEKIAEFKNLYLISILTNIPKNTIISQINDSCKKRQKLPKGELIFKIK